MCIFPRIPLAVVLEIHPRDKSGSQATISKVLWSPRSGMMLAEIQDGGRDLDAVRFWILVPALLKYNLHTIKVTILSTQLNDC